MGEKSRKGNQRNRVYTDYGGMPTCQGCLVFGIIQCPLFVAAYEKGEQIIGHCITREISEKAIKADREVQKRGKR